MEVINRCPMSGLQGNEQLDEVDEVLDPRAEVDKLRSDFVVALHDRVMQVVAGERNDSNESMEDAEDAFQDTPTEHLLDELGRCEEMFSSGKETFLRSAKNHYFLTYLEDEGQLEKLRDPNYVTNLEKEAEAAVAARGQANREWNSLKKEWDGTLNAYVDARVDARACKREFMEVSRHLNA